MKWGYQEYAASFVLLVWATAIIGDILSPTYTVDTGLHIGCGAILGAIFAGKILHRGGSDKDKDGT